MKIIFFILFLLPSCYKKETTSLRKIEREETKILKETRRRPSYNEQIIGKKITTDEEIALKEERLRLLKQEEEAYIQRLKQANGQNSQSIYSNEAVKASDFPTQNAPFVPKNEAYTPPQAQTATPKKAEILEILGSQGKNPQTQNDLLIRKKGVNNYIISTSANYYGSNLEETRIKLEKYGFVRAVKEGEQYALKLEALDGLETEEQAKKLMRKIINDSFFDVYVEQIKY